MVGRSVSGERDDQSIDQPCFIWSFGLYRDVDLGRSGSGDDLSVLFKPCIPDAFESQDQRDEGEAGDT